MTNQGGYATPEYVARKRPLDSGNDSTEAKRPFSGGNDPLLKLMVPGYMAGALIGKGGSLLNELKEKYGGNIRISAAKEYYPGTDERVVVLTGTREQIVNTSRYIMEKMEKPDRDSSMKQITIDERRAKKVKIILTNLAAGLLIGKAGSTIKGIQTSTTAVLSIIGSNEGPVPNERVLTVIASEFEHRAAAVEQIIDVISNEPSNMHNIILRYPTSPNNEKPAINNDKGIDREYLERAVMAKLGMVSHGNGEKNGGGGGGGIGVAHRLQAQVEVNVDIASSLVGGILGKHGSIVKEISQHSGGARLTFGDKLEDATAPRNLKITGNMEQTYKAYNLVEDRVAELENLARQQQKQASY